MTSFLVQTVVLLDVIYALPQQKTMVRHFLHLTWLRIL